MFSDTELPAVPEFSVTCTPGMRRMASPMLAAPLASMRWRSTTVRAPAKRLTLSCRPVPSQLPDLDAVQRSGAVLGKGAGGRKQAQGEGGGQGQAGRLQGVDGHR